MNFMLETTGGVGSARVKAHALPRAGESVLHAGHAYKVIHVAHPTTTNMDISAGIEIPHVYVKRL